MIVTGAGRGSWRRDGGRGTEQSIGVSIRLPWEQEANSVIAGDHKYVAMKYFFTRKLMLIKESKAFICLPGGSARSTRPELLTLTQTGKGLPVPIVFLDTPGDTYWKHVQDFIEGELVTRGLVTPDDVGLFLVTDDCRRRPRGPPLLRQLPLVAPSVSSW
jgi:predicted Rossmann-fold nucleotide-binding protein